mmetsp:Transcript_12190/g.52395  ORF Transcript_12190/g.52395 Transcript_12190/m.52395 type:complete len:320 (+) Transcript_12190:557-1516(+)
MSRSSSRSCTRTRVSFLRPMEVVSTYTNKSRRDPIRGSASPPVSHQAGAGASPRAGSDASSVGAGAPLTLAASSTASRVASGVTSNAKTHRIGLWFFIACDDAAAASRTCASAYVSLTRNMELTRVAPEISRTTPPPGPSTSSVIGNTAHATIALGGFEPPSANAVDLACSSSTRFSRRFRSFARNFSASRAVLCVYTFGSSPPAAGARCVSCTNARVVSVTDATGSSKMAVAGAAPLEPPTSPSRHPNATFSVKRRRYPCGAASAFSVGPRSTRHTVPRMASSGPASKAAEERVSANCTAFRGTSPATGETRDVPLGE